MRLINTETLELHEFSSDREAPKYGILSHRWGEDEVGYKDFVKKRTTSGAGYGKIVDCCAFARSRELSWLWVDTCCIDKRSSSELSEAINSMYSWYANSEECYAYLMDLDLERCRSERPSPALAKSTWFTRGWTLQELIAPGRVILLDKSWNVLGQKYLLRPTTALAHPNQLDESDGADTYMSSVATSGSDIGPCLWADITTVYALVDVIGIPPEVLLRPSASLRFMSISTRMSWMTRRATTRIEDSAYCLLGIFGINMPLLYGEGSKAFERLQMELLRSSSDESIFSWDQGLDHRSACLLAPSCSHLGPPWHETRTYWHSSQRARLFNRTPYTITNTGLHFVVDPGQGSYPFVDEDGKEVIIVALNCVFSEPFHRGLRFMTLQRLSCGHYARKTTSVQAVEERVPATDIRRAHTWPDDQSLRSAPGPHLPFRSPDREVPLRSHDIYIHFGAENHDACADVQQRRLVEEEIATPNSVSNRDIANGAMLM